MYKLCLFILSVSLFVSCNRNKKEVMEASQSLCSCFENYNDQTMEGLEGTKVCLDSIKAIGLVESVSKKKLFKQLKKDCPKGYGLITGAYNSEK